MMASKLEKTLILIKSDGLQRGLVGRIIQRLEDAGLKLMAIKMAWIDEEFAAKHYFDVAERRGEAVFKAASEYITEGPVVAIVLEGIEAAVNVRRLVGETEPKSAAPGTIRGDFSHQSFAHADDSGRAIRNLIHASGNAEEAATEIKLWFNDEELHDYTTDAQKHTF
jgi:nucleoside-diphosphate kinase